MAIDWNWSRTVVREIDVLGAENVYAALVMVSIWGRKRTLAKEFIKID